MSVAASFDSAAAGVGVGAAAAADNDDDDDRTILLLENLPSCIVLIPPSGGKVFNDDDDNVTDDDDDFLRRIVFGISTTLWSILLVLTVKYWKASMELIPVVVIPKMMTITAFIVQPVGDTIIIIKASISSSDIKNVIKTI